MATDNEFYTPNHPKKTRPRSSRTSAFGDIGNPVAEEVRDVEEQVLKLYKEFPIVPFYDQGDATLAFFHKLAQLSPTHGGCISSIRDYVLGGEFTVEKKRRTGFKMPDEDQVDNISEVEYGSFVDFIEECIDPHEFLELADCQYDNYAKTSNAFLEVVMTQVAGERFVYFYNHDAYKCRYLATLKGQPKFILISPIWTYDYIKRNYPQQVAVYPNFSSNEDGTIRTIIHTKNRVAGRDWYGEPYWLSCIYQAYNEIQHGEYNNAEYANGFTGQVFFETEGDEEGEDYDPDTENGYDSFDDALEKSFTFKGKKRKRVMHRNRPTGAKAALVHQFAPNTNEKYHEVIQGIDEKQIIKAHKWHHVLMSIPTAGKLGQTTEFRDVFKRKFYTVIKPYQRKILRPLNLALDLAMEWKGRQDLMEYRLGLISIFREMLEEQQEIKEGDSQEIDPQLEPKSEE